MKPPLLLILLAICAATVNAETQNTVLGQGFGKIITIKGIMIDDRDTKLRRDLGRMLVEVSEVNGKLLDKKLTIPISTFSFANTKVPNRKTHVELRGYETGGYHGIPKDAFKDIPMVATDGFYFESYFMITAVVSPKSAEQSTPSSGSGGNPSP
jgi:hypothetical protein